MNITIIAFFKISISSSVYCPKSVSVYTGNIVNPMRENCDHNCCLAFHFPFASMHLIFLLVKQKVLYPQHNRCLFFPYLRSNQSIIFLIPFIFHLQVHHQPMSGQFIFNLKIRTQKAIFLASKETCPELFASEWIFSNIPLVPKNHTLWT